MPSPPRPIPLENVLQSRYVQDGDLTDASRWSCAPSLGGVCSVSYDLGAVRDLAELKLGKMEFYAPWVGSRLAGGLMPLSCVHLRPLYML